MALRLVRQTSDTSNITNKDDVIMTRYAYGGYNGVVNGFGNECGYTAENGIFKILDGRIVVDGWEIDVDGAGWSFDFSNITGTQYHSVYAEINVSVETVDIKSSYYTGNYPTIEKGDDLTQIPNGTARLLLYNVQVENGAITEVIKKVEVVPYLPDVELKIDNKFTSLSTSLVTGAMVVKKAEIAQYATSDTSKGTIEGRFNALDRRLTSLGFKSGSATIASGSASPNNLYRQGNYVYGRIGITGGTRALNATWFTLPQNFRPKTAFTTSARGQLKGTVYTNIVTRETWLTLKFNTDGTVVVTEADTSLVEYLTGITKLNDVQFGFEAPPIA